MHVRIHDLTTNTSYVATSREECRGVDAHVWDMVQITGDTITMGKVIGHPVEAA